MEISPQTSPPASPAKDDPLDQYALEIARRNKLEGESLQKLSKIFPAGATTLHRKIKGWLEQGRFELTDTWSGQTTASQTVIDEPLGERLARATSIRRARVAHLSGVEAATGEDYRMQTSNNERAQAAYQAGDFLHRALGDVAARFLIDQLRPQMTIGLASGRGVALTVDRLEELAKDRREWMSGYQGVKIVSLSGGSWMGTWAMPFNRPLDADANVFHLGTILHVSPRIRTYIGSWLLAGERVTEQSNYDSVHLDLAIVGIGQLNTGHHFLRPDAALQMESMSDALDSIRDFQDKEGGQHASIADICHVLFYVGTGQPPNRLAKAIGELNKAMSTAPGKTLENAEEVILVAGGAQKEEALYHFIKGNCRGAPIDPARVTLITDSWTANRILERG
jgi:DNA-binding transcriptional regulator LsrR (DeoR family)